VQAASAGNPGIPPSSLMSFLRLNASVQGLVLTEFDTAFTNPYFASRFDNGSHVSTDSIAATAAVLAAALYRLAGGGQQLQVRGCFQVFGFSSLGLSCRGDGESWR
jgi:nicastrin